MAEEGRRERRGKITKGQHGRSLYALNCCWLIHQRAFGQFSLKKTEKKC